MEERAPRPSVGKTARRLDLLSLRLGGGEVPDEKAEPSFRGITPHELLGWGLMVQYRKGQRLPEPISVDFMSEGEDFRVNCLR
jgi:hypothetical protein